mmetsp:Transcript_39510/g.65518  ORF Transcript_39510/g.65518 Transcript_39510/m.65518 type:complete len:318 (+) Transcript_39510:116-1069(+)|eukprot:CAMPEP_0119335504 /NCGR_PEP_ID=MMETSP1333-20130426/89732_1 /TAXON_ID=418940 /ORGANISM="Scyphosphaera apsteinii, Strain RCC1455" /LENGTH=317 /DNA_ID=CAMNT_0007346063 /DNA_START=101 /DNA_END=1054 /DNA_ORIENTATION=-
MADVVDKRQPGKVDPFGTGKVLVVDCLGPYQAETSDPFLMLHAFGPTHISGMPTFGMHPHRGFCEVPYLKKGTWFSTDPWNMQGVGEDAKFLEGQLQWGKAGCGIEHGMRKDSSYDGPVMGFQLWVNLKAANKLDPPVFQNARPESLPLLTLTPKVTAKLLVGELNGKRSPVDTFGVDCTYVDYMLEVGGEAAFSRAAGRDAAFVYVYEGKGSFGAKAIVASAGEILRFGPVGDILIRADQGSKLGVMLLVGTPLREPIVQHGPFVMSSRAQIMQAFEQYQRGQGFIANQCEYQLHTVEGTMVTKRGLEEAYLRQWR